MVSYFAAAHAAGSGANRPAAAKSTKNEMKKKNKKIKKLIGEKKYIYIFSLVVGNEKSDETQISI